MSSWLDFIFGGEGGGGGGGGSQPFIATFTWDSDLQEYSCDKTPEEIKAAADSGQVVMCDVPAVNARGYYAFGTEYEDGNDTKTFVLFFGAYLDGSFNFNVLELSYNTDGIITQTDHPLT